MLARRGTRAASSASRRCAARRSRVACKSASNVQRARSAASGPSRAVEVASMAPLRTPSGAARRASIQAS
eukprot:5571733-Pleurochrysis_carterae.AAC.1